MAIKQKQLLSEMPIAQTNIKPYWLPFSSNRKFKDNPRVIVSAEGCYYLDADGRKIFDGFYPGKANVIPYFWLPNWSDEIDPSAREL